MPPETPQFRPPQLSHTQAAPKVFQRTHPPQNQNDRPQLTGQGAVLPITNSSRFKPSVSGLPSSNTSVTDARSQSSQQQQGQQIRRQSTMGPPPTPQHLRRQAGSSTNLQGVQSSNGSNSSSSNSAPQLNIKPSANRFFPANRRFVPPMSQGQQIVPSSTSGAPQRFFAVSGAGNLGSMPDDAFASGSNQQALSSMSTGGQRMSFNPGGGFG